MESAASSGKVTHPTQPQRQRYSRWLVPAIILTVILLMAGCVSVSVAEFSLWAQFQRSSYAQAAPGGWTNITLHGTALGMQYAISQNDPGVIMACGTLSGGFQDTTACWRTFDGGAQWQTLREAPFENASAYELAAPRDAGQTFFAIEDNGLVTDTTAADAIWVTHDAGQSWRKVTTLTLDYDGVQIETAELSNAIYRNGRWYGLLESNGQLDVIPRTFSVSLNDGATWTPAEHKPSALEQQGWSGFSLATDYRAPPSWFRTMEREGPGEYLEHSSDDGRSWQTVSQITSSAPTGFANLASESLATTPTLLGALCVSGFDVGLVASADGGHTWRTGMPTATMTTWQGFQEGAIHIGADGTCYASFDRQISDTSLIGKLFPSGPDYELALLQLAPDTSQITQAPLPSGYSDVAIDNEYDIFAYAPAGHGISARLVLQANTSGSSWLSVFSSTDPQSNNLLIWRAVP